MRRMSSSDGDDPTKKGDPAKNEPDPGGTLAGGFAAQRPASRPGLPPPRQGSGSAAPPFRPSPMTPRPAPVQPVQPQPVVQQPPVQQTPVHETPPQPLPTVAQAVAIPEAHLL